MAHKVLVGGTAYDLTGGKTLIGGTEYLITKGRTLIGGTGYDISFVKATFDDLMADATLITSAGRDSSSSRTIRITLNSSTPNGVYYLFALTWAGFDTSPLNSRATIYKVEWTGDDATLTQLKYSDSANGNYLQIYKQISTYSVSLYLSIDGTQSSQYFGGTIQLLQFPSYPPSVCDKTLSGIGLNGVSGRNSSTSQGVSAAYTGTERWLVSWDGNLAYNSPLGTVIYGNYATNPSLLYLSSSYAAISTNGTSAASVYSGAIHSIT